ncbi:MAG: M1 family metallopeptidase [Reichenbachiella sp.]
MNKLSKVVIGSFLMVVSFSVQAQSDRWQQGVSYYMEIDMDAEANQFTGLQELTYYNNSPDTLTQVYFHLYYNAFQPGSMMDVRSRTIVDPDPRVADRIYNLSDEEIGYHKINGFTQEGNDLDYEIEGTVMQVRLSKPILPNSTTTFKMNFTSQVPLQIRRTGRDNKEGIELSMAQWFPKIAEYDKAGWHAHSYVAREFYSPWGDYEVKITIDSAYTVAGSGVLQNPEEIGKGYADIQSDAAKLTYHFKVDNVHDFVWAADPDYRHDILNIKEGLDFHFFYQKDTLTERWEELQQYVTKMLPFIEENFGEYPYPVYSVIQGGDGGMEYPMATLITGHRSSKSLIGVTVHELMHSWYQMMLGTNESYLAWMDEGFTSYASALTMSYLYEGTKDPFYYSKKGYVALVESGKEEPLTTHSDFFNSNRAYGVAAYSKGALTLRQLEYIIGTEAVKEGLLKYYRDWKFKHPDALDFQKVMEEVSGVKLDWYFDFWVKTTKSIDYAISSVRVKDKKTTTVQLQKIGEMPMPVDVKVVLENGEEKWFHIALSMMRGAKEIPDNHMQLSNWPWVYPYYTFDILIPLKDIKSIEIDPEKLVADMDEGNNVYPFASSTIELKGEVE